ncbi:Zn-dependent oligopeptidase [Aestuariibacter halophilus]|uniref:Zn-dependent oligopeptidase n=1 Tax=Fluctibacter halophilus TaxID=226011 RepID=A0ABS8G948_9ALTE|nr:M3 family metallopeptidase [Aestuariibacter halophilus]MCC2617075.1 Zn-dependent oligopeptidase [Aestuariibacter halophilus]
MKLRLLTPVAALVLSACQTTTTISDTNTTSASATAMVQNDQRLTDGIDPSLSAQQLTTLCDAVLAKANDDFSAIESATTPASWDSVIGAYEQINFDLQQIQHSWYIKAVHPDADVRDAATQCGQQYSDYAARVNLSKPYYERLAAIDTAPLSEVQRHMLKQTLENYERAGMDKDQQTRDKIRALLKDITEIGNVFNQNIREDVRHITVTAEQLAGLPQDYLDDHPADADGNITISTDYPDLYPVMTYAENDDVRKELRIAARSRGYPQNADVLKSLIEKRHELANLLGFENFAALSMADKMIGNPDNAQAFLAKVGEALDEPVKRELAILLERLKAIEPTAEQVQVWQAGYLMNLLRQEQYALDSKEVRQYFSYDKVRKGIFQLTEDLFGVEIRPWETETWHEDVETFEILEDGQLLGRFYMDNHPRPNKYKHAAHWTLRTGLKDRQIPLSGLAQNFPKGLMEHGQVETFLHEFGHLLHNMFSGNQQWFGVAGMSMERDFVEAPSQMLEEWIWDYDTLKGFATNAAGEPIPKALVDKMNKARDFGKATGTATQIFYANLSLNYYNRDPSTFELEPLMLALQETYAPYPYVEGTHFYANFGHLNGYSSNYYTYQWSLAIATDLFSVFEQQGMRNQDVATAYREKVLGAAGSKPAREFVAEFLGRPFSPDAYIESLKAL